MKASPLISYIVRHPAKGVSIQKLFRNIQIKVDQRWRTQWIEAPYWGGRNLWKCLLNAIDARRHQGDVNHVTGDFHYQGIFLKRRKTVLTVHDCIILHTSSRLHRAVLWLFWYFVPMWRAGVVTTISEATQTELLRYVPWFAWKTVVVRNCVSDAFEYAPKPFPSGQPRILQIGTADNKNLWRVAKALEGIDCNLRVVGRMTEEDHRQLQVAQLNFSNVVDLDDTEVVEEYRKCDLLLFASTYEGFGLPIVEAQATGRPVITSTVASMPEVAGGAAVLVDPADIQQIRKAVLQVIRDAGLRKELVADGLENVKKYRANCVATQYERIYEAIVDGNLEGYLENCRSEC